jgi:hypothetical protein
MTPKLKEFYYHLSMSKDPSISSSQIFYLLYLSEQIRREAKDCRNGVFVLLFHHDSGYKEIPKGRKDKVWKPRRGKKKKKEKKSNSHASQN